MNKNFLLKKTISNIHTIIKILIYFLFMNIAHADKWSDKFPHIEKTGDVPGKCSYEATSKKNYNNKVLRINTDVGPAIGGRTILHAQQFEELTGAKFKITKTHSSDIYSQTKDHLQSGKTIYDIVFGFTNFPINWTKYLEPVPARYVNTPQMRDVIKSHINIASSNGKIFYYPINGYRHYLKYRKDVIDNPKYKKKYKADTGKMLRLPKTWKEYGEIAKYFNGWDWDGDGEKEYGSSEIMKKNRQFKSYKKKGAMFTTFIGRSAAYSKNPRTTGGYFFDLLTMSPLINNPGFVEALKDWVEATKYIPPGGIYFGHEDEINSFGKGQTLFSFSWDDAFKKSMDKESSIKNKVGTAPLPGADMVFNRNSGKWENIYNQPTFTAWGWTAAVTKNAEDHEMAFDFLCFFANEANHQADILINKFGVSPYRKSDFSSDIYIERLGWDTKISNGYVKTLLDLENNDNKVFSLRVPGAIQFTNALEDNVSKALSGELSPKNALDEVSKEWKKIIKKIGKDKIRKIYASEVALEDNRTIPLNYIILR